MKLYKQPAHKQFNTLVSSTISSSAVFQDLSLITQGTTFNQRVGAQVNVVSATIKMFLVCADATNYIRTVLFTWRPSDSSDVPTASELFIDTASAAFTSLLAYKPSRFKVWHDKCYPLTTAGNTYCRTEVVTLRNVGAIQYDIGVNTGSRHLYLAIVSDSGASTHPPYTIDCNMIFTD